MGRSTAHRETKFCDTVIAQKDNAALVALLVLASFGDLIKLHN
jgi:hypothetical protein